MRNLYYSNNGELIEVTLNLDFTSTIDQFKKLPKSQPWCIVNKFFNLDNNLIFDYQCKKIIMQSLRHFDEVGVCNELWEALDNIPSSTTYFYLFEDRYKNDIDLLKLKLKNISLEDLTIK